MAEAIVTEWRPVGRCEEWTEGQGRTVALGARRIAVWRQGERWFALKDACPHRGLPLSTARIQGGEITCPAHGWRFDPGTGASRSGCAAATCYPVRQRDGVVEVGL